MRKVTVDDIMAHYPCDEYPRERVEELWSGKESLTLTEILDLDIPAEDRIWAVTRFLTDEKNGQFARWCSLRVVHLWDCPDVVKQRRRLECRSGRRSHCWSGRHLGCLERLGRSGLRSGLRSGRC